MSVFFAEWWRGGGIDIVQDRQIGTYSQGRDARHGGSLGIFHLISIKANDLYIIFEIIREKSTR